MAPVFLAMGIAAGFVGGLKPSQMGKEFVDGAKSLAFGALVIGLARGILIVLQDGLVLDTIVKNLAGLLNLRFPVITSISMFLVNMFINFLIPSGSGQAAAVMPLMIPIGDLTGISRQISVLAFQMGDGFTNAISPTSSNMNSYISLARISYPTWFKFTIPIILTWTLSGFGFLIIAHIINLGPF